MWYVKINSVLLFCPFVRIYCTTRTHLSLLFFTYEMFIVFLQPTFPNKQSVMRNIFVIKLFIMMLSCSNRYIYCNVRIDANLIQTEVCVLNRCRTVNIDIQN